MDTDVKPLSLFSIHLPIENKPKLRYIPVVSRIYNLAILMQRRSNRNAALLKYPNRGNRISWSVLAPLELGQ